jgi:hypothetical protein
MAANPKPYYRLPGTGYRYVIPAWAMFLLFFVIGIFVLLFRGRRVQLWQGGEHLLLVEWDGYREYYKRFDYRDIQSVIIRKTSETVIFNTILAAIVCILGVLAIVTPETGFRVFLLSLAAVLGLILLANALSGPACRCSIRTAVQTDELPSLNRLRRARKVFARLRPLIAAAQGQLAAEEIPARMSELAQAPAAAPENPPVPQAVVIDDPNAPPKIV